MTISPSDNGTNLKPRKLFCPKCKTTIISDEPAARCVECNQKLITVVFDELVTTANKPT